MITHHFILMINTGSLLDKLLHDRNMTLSCCSLQCSVPRLIMIIIIMIMMILTMITMMILMIMMMTLGSCSLQSSVPRLIMIIMIIIVILASHQKHDDE